MHILFITSLFALIAPSLSHALVRELANCETADGAYQISVQDNRGIGFNRSLHITAQVRDADGGLVANYAAEIFRGARSPSFGRDHFQDSASAGEAFMLSAPSTNFPHYSLKARISGGALSYDNLSCSIFQAE